jgi:hypothetical protein
MLLKSGKEKRCAMPLGTQAHSSSLDDLVSLPTCRFWKGKILAWVRLFWIFIFAYEGVGILLLIEVAEGMVDFTMLALVCTNYCLLAEKFSGIAR